MCIKNINNYTQCGHTGVKVERCEIYNVNPKSCRSTEKHPETINDLCRKCGGGPQQKPVINYVDTEAISSWSRNAVTSLDTTSRLDSSVELVRKGSQKAIDGMKRFIAGSIRSARSSGGSSSLVDTVSETETPTFGENAASYPNTNEPFTESKTFHSSRSRANHWQTVTESSSGLIHSSSNTPGSTRVSRPSAGRDNETASIVTTWTKIISKASGQPDGERAEAKQFDEDLYEKRVEAPQINEVMYQRRLAEFAKADERLARRHTVHESLRAIRC
ncbi:hypothetical protein N431DRAFT_543149 [Stipitochalara longipes BDJ]|nr:hypothetical protein N431DRAFT_543149 [Stipitochalara longipes BDJ]